VRPGFQQMGAFDLTSEWRQLLPRSVHVVAGPLLEQPPPLTPNELASAGSVSAKRLLELQCGRFYAKQALSAFGVSDVDLSIGRNRAPIWPDQVIGSITHIQRGSSGYCAAAVARRDEVSALGIDMEYDSGLTALAWPRFLSEAELREISALPAPDREAEVLTRWCIKESIIKATGQVLEPISINTLSDLKTKSFSANFSAVQFGEGKTNSWKGRIRRLNGLILAAVAITSAEPGSLLVRIPAINSCAAQGE
jgi:4'-phosphopantetheinyl transferase EntD